MIEQRADILSSPRRSRPMLRLVIMLLCVGVLFFLVFGFGIFRTVMIGKFLATLSNPPQTVATIQAQTSSWQPSIDSVGSVVAINGANLSAQVNGIVDTIDFKSGDTVPAGQLLVTLRAVNDPAILAQLQATVALDEINYQRDLKQFGADAIAQSTVDADRTGLQTAQAQVQSQQALIAEKQIKAPFAGTLGIRDVDIGQYLSAGTQIVTLQQLNPLFVDFYLPQQALAQVKVGQQVSIGVDAFANQTFGGSVSAINSALDASTRTVQVRATINNDGLLLRPGMFTTVRIDIGQARPLVTLPQAAIAYNSYGDTVYIVKHSKDSKGNDQLIADQTFVTLGDTRGDQVAVLSGVSPGDQVVTAGQVKLNNGSIVLINNSIQPFNDSSPNPPNE